MADDDPVDFDVDGFDASGGPTLALPLTLTTAGGFASYPQDGNDEIRQSVELARATRLGERLFQEGFGTRPAVFMPAPAFDPDAIRAAIEEQEPRAKAAVEVIPGATTRLQISIRPGED